MVDNEREGHDIDGDHKGMDRVSGFIGAYFDIPCIVSFANCVLVNEKDAR